jgi:hypothetical protein
VRSVPVEIEATRSALTAEIQATRRDLLATVNTQATAIRKRHALEVKRRDRRVFVLFVSERG